MNPQDPLAGLHPLRQPELVGWWPLAPGWWILIVMATALLAALAFYLYRRHQANRYRRQAATQLEQLHSNWLDNRDSHRYLSDTNALLKSVALRAFPQQDLAARHGEYWVQFLNDSMSPTNGSIRFEESFVTAAYRPEAPAIDCDEVQQIAMTWIQQHRAAR